MLQSLKYFYSVTSNHHISVADKKDIPALVELVNKAYRNVDANSGWTTEANLFEGSRANEESLKHLSDHSHSVFLKYAKDNKIVGCVYLHKQQSKMYLGVLAVSPECQDTGIGKELLSGAEEYARKHKCNTITMTVISIRQELVAWYKRRGYNETGEIKPFPYDKVNRPKQALELLVLEKKLD
jgi:ribosomal protein S18 acetylase RimI-like enzyme